MNINLFVLPAKGHRVTFSHSQCSRVRQTQFV